MKLKDSTIYLSAPSAVVTILVTMLFAVGLVQILTVEIAREFFERPQPIQVNPPVTTPPVDPRSSSEIELSARIKGAQRKFLPDGCGCP